jgi:hypothetical protein
MPEIDINYVAVLVSALITFFLGALWYSPVLFANLWMKGAKITDADIKKAKEKGMAGSYVMAGVTALLMSYVLAHWVDIAGANTPALGAQAGFWAWLGYIATTHVGTVTWEGKSWSYYFVNVGYYLVALLIAGALLARWA